MKKHIIFALFVVACYHKPFAQDTCKVGVFVTDIYDLNLAEKSFNAKFWVWGLYKKDSLKILENLELIEAKENDYLLATIEKRGKLNYAAQKAKTTFKKDWDITNFPFDEQELNIIIESGDAETNELVLIPDIKNSTYDSANIKINGWKISQFKVTSKTRQYNSNYGDPEIVGKAAYSNFIASIKLKRDSDGLFFKLFTGLYVAFIISLLPYFMGPENAERFGLLVGSLFAAVANKYVVDAILPETNNYTLVDKIHVITFIYILISLIMTVISYRLFAMEKTTIAKKVDNLAFWITFSSYIAINFYLINQVI